MPLLVKEATEFFAELTHVLNHLATKLDIRIHVLPQKAYNLLEVVASDIENLRYKLYFEEGGWDEDDHQESHIIGAVVDNSFGRYKLSDDNNYPVDELNMKDLVIDMFKHIQKESFLRKVHTYYNNLPNVPLLKESIEKLYER